MTVISDLNDDNVLVIVIANIDFDVVGVFFGYVDGSFIEQTTYSIRTGSDPITVAIGDFNKDNKLDIVVVNFLDGNIMVMLQNGSGPFQSMSTYSTGEYSIPPYMAIADLNNDDHLDIVVNNCGYDNIGILLGYGDGIVMKQITYAIGNASKPYSVAVGDFNNDTLLDIAVANFVSNDVSILLGYGNEHFSI
ncbi:unnamed protein product [Rotaria magnacalcarata]|uniref:VCBS repeat-containing protein n=1 Tax=Rotaria magnacalcarata TaxID=392030 RepID=A0A816U8B3_9BILA|nr:unnamed protein product [Rotaria magnacalcarata]CAF1656458.1 unnamed protein product [Rotaria magnacalcarata]CAF2104805.1 unnamed protein product [Rotaria magnacalcarata]CAF4339576.1 unnamed protein product [Rotaria magnacalcarata]CAF4353789.1 unnamed protein product [Rotaria magnacalcarata]